MNTQNKESYKQTPQSSSWSEKGPDVLVSTLWIAADGSFRVRVVGLSISVGEDGCDLERRLDLFG